VEWFYENKAFKDEWLMRNLSMMKDDNNIRIIHPIKSSYELLAMSILIWMPIHMTGKTSAYFIPKYKDTQLTHSYFLIKDHMAVYNWSPHQSNDINTYITHEPQMVKDIEILLQHYFDASTKIFDRYYFETHEDYLNNMVSVLEKENSEYHWCTVFPLCNLSESLLKEILEDNGITAPNAISMRSAST
jgi:hypothetical protein